MKISSSWVVYLTSFVLLVSVILIISVASNPQVKINLYNDNDFDFYLKMQRKNDPNILVRANNALIDIYDFNNYPSINSDLDNIWRSKNYKNNSHELYVHSLTILWDLLIAHQKTHNNNFLIKGKKIIQSWIDNNKISNPLNSRYSWSEHSTSTRTITILLFFDYYKKFYEIDELLNEEIDDYCSDALYFLSNSTNYTYKNNHGIFQDIALLFLSNHLSNNSLRNRYKNISIKRFEEQILSTISPKGIHLENSAGYNFVISNQIQTFLAFLGNNEHLSDEVLDRIRLLEENKSAFIFPDSEIVPVGDTHRNKFDYDIELESHICIHDTLAGYEIFKKDNKEYLLIRSNGILQNHMHQDEFSFVYYSHGNKIVTDPGFLDFSNSFSRQYSESFQAHNSILPTILLDNFNIHTECLFKSYAQDDNCYYSELSGEVEHSQVKREFLLKNNYLLILDSILTSNEQDWLRIFNLSDDVEKINVISDTTIELIMKDDETFYFTSYMNPLEIIKGHNSPKIGWLAEPGKQLNPSHTIIQKNSRLETKFIIGISRNNPLKFKHEKDILFIQGNSETDSLQIKNDEVIINGNSLKKTSLEKSYNIQKTNNFWYNMWLRVRDYRIQLLFLNVIALLIILIFIVIYNRIKFCKNKLLFYSITIVSSYICMIMVFVKFFK